jgi:hypothetical protein
LNSIDFPLLGLEYYGGYGLIAGVGRWDFQGLTMGRTKKMLFSLLKNPHQSD